MDPLAKIPPVSRRLDYVLQALEDICTRLDKIHDVLAATQRAPDRAGTPAMLTLKQAAEALSISQRTMRSLAGREIAYVKIGRRTSFMREDLDRFIARNRRDWGSSRWVGKGRRRYGNEEERDKAYLERLTKPDPSEQMPALDDDFSAAPLEQRVQIGARRALRLAGINSITKAQTFSYDELLSIKGIGINIAPRILKAVGTPIPKGADPDKWR